LSSACSSCFPDVSLAFCSCVRGAATSSWGWAVDWQGKS
jgi:hypothetical protein